MKNRKILSLLVCLGSVCTLAGCDKETVTPEVPEVKTNETKIESLLDGFKALYQTQNYTFDVVHSYGTYREEIPNMLFTKDYIGYDSKMLEDLNVLYNDGKGIFRVSFADDYLCGEYLADLSGHNYTNLWDNSVVTTMYSMGGAYIKKNVTADTKEFEITDKDYKVRFMQTIVGSTNQFANIDSLIAKYENDKCIFYLSLDNGTNNYKVTLKDVGNTESAHLKTFIKNDGKPFAPNADLTEMRRLLYKDNFVQRTYMVNGDTKYWSGYQFFTEHYYFMTGNDSTVGNAYMEFNYKESEELENDFDMWGIYMVNVSKDQDGKIVAGLVNKMAYNSSTLDIEECCKYPSRKLNLLTSLEYIKEGEVRDADYETTADFFTGESKKYFIVDEKLVNNFANNFSLDTDFQDVIWNTVAIEIEIAENDKDSIVCFHCIGYYPTDGMTYDIICPLYGFGDANRTALDYLYEQYNVQ